MIPTLATFYRLVNTHYYSPFSDHYMNDSLYQYTNKKYRKLKSNRKNYYFGKYFV